MSKQERDYVLGTHDAEIERLGIPPEWAAKMRAEAKAIDENPNAFFITPMVLEIVARKL